MRRRLILAWLRGAALVAAHAADLVLRDGLRGWRRGARTAAPALGTLYAVLLLAGTGTLAAAAARHTLDVELQRAALVRVYLKPDVAIADVDVLRERLLRDPRVASVEYVDADAALAEAIERPGLARLAEAAGDNPFPARLEVRATSLAGVAPIVRGVTGESVVDPTTPTSFDPGAYDDLRRFLGVAGAVALGVLAALGLVAAAVTANAVRASVLVRGEELAVMRLLGAGGLVLRGPLVVEAALTGALAGLLAGATALALYAGVEQLAARTFTVLLPGVDWRIAGATAGALPVLGTLIGALGAVLGLRRGGAS
jgi:cell division transport system permease protein